MLNRNYSIVWKLLGELRYCFGKVVSSHLAASAYNIAVTHHSHDTLLSNARAHNFHGVFPLGKKNTTKSSLISGFLPTISTLARFLFLRTATIAIHPAQWHQRSFRRILRQIDSVLCVKKTIAPSCYYLQWCRCLQRRIDRCSRPPYPLLPPTSRWQPSSHQTSTPLRHPLWVASNIITTSNPSSLAVPKVSCRNVLVMMDGGFRKNVQASEMDWRLILLGPAASIGNRKASLRISSPGSPKEFFQSKLKPRSL